MKNYTKNYRFFYYLRLYLKHVYNIDLDSYRIENLIITIDAIKIYILINIGDKCVGIEVFTKDFCQYAEVRISNNGDIL